MNSRIGITLTLVLATTSTIFANRRYDGLTCIDSSLEMGVKRNLNNNNKLVFKTCDWASNIWRCNNKPGLAESCPLSCNKCGISDCKDSPFRFKYPLQNGQYSGKKRTCAWVATGNTKKKCKRPGVTATCRETCLACVKQSCHAAYPEVYVGILGNGNCDNYGNANTPECGHDGGDCIDFNALYPNCTHRWTSQIGNGRCENSDSANSAGCGYDGGDCESFNEQYPDCRWEEAHKIGDGVCRPNSITNTPECGYDGGDCDWYNEMYPNCTAVNDEMLFMGNGRCEGQLNTPECGGEMGDCDEFNRLYPECKASLPYLVGDGYCRNMHHYNTAECGFDGGDCKDFNDQYPNCPVSHPHVLGDGVCQSYANLEECGFDGGDCL